MEERLKLARDAISNHQPMKAVEMMVDFIREHPEHVEARTLLIRALAQLGQQPATDQWPADYTKSVATLTAAILMPILALVWGMSLLSPELLHHLAPCIAGGLSLLPPLVLLLPLPARHPIRPTLDSMVHMFGIAWLAGSVIYLLAVGPREGVWLIMLLLLGFSLLLSLVIAIARPKAIGKAAVGSMTNPASVKSADTESSSPRSPATESAPLPQTTGVPDQGKH